MTEDTKSGTDTEIKNILIRENLVETAVNFLLNASVKNKPDHTKVAFLKNKGLTDPEISAAFHKAQSDPAFSDVTQQNRLQNSFIPQPQPYYQKTYSFWSKLSSISSSLIVIAVALYGLHRFYKLYIEPWLFGTKPRGEEMKELVLELSNSVTQLKNSVSTLEFTVNSQKEQIDSIFLAEGSPYMPIPMAVAELKTEIGNVKSLLINRHQFPAVPKVVSNPSIPLWQLSGSEAKQTEGEFNTDKKETDESLSPRPASSDKDQDINKKLNAESGRELCKDQFSFNHPNVLLTAENSLNGTHGVDIIESTFNVQAEGKSNIDMKETDEYLSLGPESFETDQNINEKLNAESDDDLYNDRFSFDQSHSLLTVENGINGRHKIDLIESTSNVENEDKIIPKGIAD